MFKKFLNLLTIVFIIGIIPIIGISNVNASNCKWTTEKEEEVTAQGRIVTQTERMVVDEDNGCYDDYNTTITIYNKAGNIIEVSKEEYSEGYIKYKENIKYNDGIITFKEKINSTIDKSEHIKEYYDRSGDITRIEKIGKKGEVAEVVYDSTKQNNFEEGNLVCGGSYEFFGETPYWTSSKGFNIENIPPMLPKTIHLVYIGLQIVVPIILVIFGMIDLFKGIMAQKDDEIKKGQQIFIKRLITAAIIFFVFSIVKLIISLVGDDSSSIINCMDCFINDKCIKVSEGGKIEKG